MYAYEWDRKTDVIVRSAEFAHILGLKDDPNITTCHQMLKSVHPDDREKILIATDGCTPENPTCRVRYRVIRPDGSVVWLEKNAHAFFDGNGSILRMIGMVADITERKLAEEAISSMSRRLIEAQEAERARIARDLHDNIGQRLALLSITLEQTSTASPNSSNEPRLGEMRKQLSDIAARVRNLSHELHSSALRLLDVEDALQGFCKELAQKQHVEIDFVSRNVPKDMARDVSLCLFRVLQEALRNAVKYSGERRFKVELQGTSGSVNLTIRDFGIGFDPELPMKGQGLGLISM